MGKLSIIRSYEIEDKENMHQTNTLEFANE